MNLKDKRLLSILVSVVFGLVLLVIILFKYPFKEVISTFTNLTPLLVLIYLVVSGFIMLFLSLRWKIVLDALGYKIPFYKLFGYRVVGYGVSYITPSAKIGGEPLRAALLKRQGLSFREGLSSVIVDKTLELSYSVLFFIFGLLVLVVDYALSGRTLFALIIFSVITLFLLWKFYSRILRGKSVFTHLFRFFGLHKLKFLSKYQDLIFKFEKPIINFYQTKRKEFFIASAVSIISLILSLVEYKLILLMLGIDVSVGVVFMVFSMIGIAFLIPLPMALGSLEAFQISLFSITKIGPAVAGVGLAMITR
ncbi:flippase-like domain-containing protein [Candidatus Woesearchaeota archaeon]|nr:flippase-like domain-containing protein [Candidatus Woesearchaeota archaeon]